MSGTKLVIIVLKKTHKPPVRLIALPTKLYSGSALLSGRTQINIERVTYSVRHSLGRDVGMHWEPPMPMEPNP